MLATCELHRHAGGSISAITVYEILKRDGKLADLTLQDISHRMKCVGTNIGFASFLSKFTILDELDWDEWAIDLAAAQICDDF